jgi:hypothetical protein
MNCRGDDHDAFGVPATEKHASVDGAVVRVARRGFHGDDRRGHAELD